MEVCVRGSVSGFVFLALASGCHLPHDGSRPQNVTSGVDLLTDGSPLTTAKSYYVATDGDDLSPGTEKAPFRTIQRAADQAEAGDTVLIKGGTYAGFSVFKKEGAEGAPITFKSQCSERVILDGAKGKASMSLAPDGRIGYVILVRGAYITIEGLEVTDSSVYPDYKYTIGGMKVDDYYSVSHHIRIINNKWYHLSNMGLLVSYVAHHCEISNNQVSDIGSVSKRGYGMYIGGTDHVIRKNVIHGAYGQGLQVYSYDTGVPGAGGSPPSRNLIDSNLVYDNGHTDYAIGYPDWHNGVGTVSGAGISVDGGGTGNTVSNNIVINNLAAGIELAESSHDFILNNTVYLTGNHTCGIFVANQAGSTVQNNISYQNRAGDAYIGPGNTVSSNLFGVDPKFANATAYDVHLQRASQAIGSGLTSPRAPSDFDGNQRRSGACDIGAYQSAL
jgi:parallel beta-helix repeat protein